MRCVVFLLCVFCQRRVPPAHAAPHLLAAQLERQRLAVLLSVDEQYHEPPPVALHAAADRLGRRTHQQAQMCVRSPCPPRAPSLTHFAPTDDERFDPYPASKRRAVSPALALASLSPIYIPRPRAVPVPLPGSLPGSVASSPTVAHRHTGVGIAGSPTLRASVALASPIARPIRLSGRNFEEGLREVNGAGDGVSGLTLE
jgi:hypothetical protein